MTVFEPALRARIDSLEDEITSNETNTQRFAGRTAVVTGAGQGIGESTALLFAEQGASVAVVDINGDHAESVAEKILGVGGQAIPVSCDVSRPEDVKAAVVRVVDEFGRLDILVNNAGIMRDALVHKMTEQDWDAVLSVNLKGAFLFSQAAQRIMVPQRYGKIVMTSSRSALGGSGQTNYSSSKAGLLGLASALAWELGQFGVNVNAVAPGHLTTDMTKGTAERLGKDYDEMRSQKIAANALKTVAMPRDIANVIAFLASDEASLVTGQCIFVTGRPCM